MENVTPIVNAQSHYIISQKDQAIINDLNVYFRKTPPLETTSHSTMSDRSYTSAVDFIDMSRASSSQLTSQ
ncbi:13148_t:CDS:1, partial [Rhizophagus irregularis]